MESKRETPKTLWICFILGFFLGPLACFLGAEGADPSPSPLSPPPIRGEVALAQWNQGKKGLALAHLRKEVVENPHFSQGREGIQWIYTHMEIPEVPRQIVFFEVLRERILQYLSVSDIFIPLICLSLGLVGVGVPWASGRRIGGGARFFLFGLIGPAFLAFLLLAGLKTYDLGRARGTVVLPKVGVHSGPSSEAPKLEDLYEGFEVVLNEKYSSVSTSGSVSGSGSGSASWIQITHPGGVTGWVPAEALFVTQDGGEEKWQ